MSGAADTTPKVEVDPFEAAFADIVAENSATAAAAAAPAPAATPEPEPKPAEPAPKAEAPVVEPAPAAGAAVTPPAEGQPAEGTGTPAAGAAPAPTPAPAPAPTDEDDKLLKRFADIVAKTPKEEPKPAAPAPAAEAPALFTPEEVTLLAEYDRDYPDIAKAEATRRRGEYNQLVGWMFQQIGSQLQPFIETLNQLAIRTQHQEITSAVTDYDAVREHVVDWASKQPKYLQDAYAHVINSGTPEEVKDLVTRWRTETGTPVAAPAAAGTPATPAKTELPQAAKQAAASLAPVSSKRSAVAAGTVDPNDFDSAFAAFAGKP